MKQDYSPDTFPYEDFKRIKYLKRPRGNIGHKIRHTYKDIITAFDIETTNLKEIEQSVMYIWQWHFDEIGTVFGRTWQEFQQFARKIAELLNGLHMIVFVHNLSFEFQFLAGIYDFKQEEVFAIEKRKVLKCNMLDCLEFRCSYLLTNMSLSVFLTKMGVENQKLSGEVFDYSKQRFSFTDISDQELAYCRNDVVGLVQAIKILNNSENDNLYTMPLTSTGYVRRDCKKAMRKAYRGSAKDVVQDYHVFELLRRAFRGGNTHANRYMTERNIYNVKSCDRKSSYPSELCNSKFPMKEFVKLPGTLSRDRIEKLIYLREKPLLFACHFSNLRLKNDKWGCPYLPVSKCENVSKNTVLDNGRILKSESFDMVITDVDYKIINFEYSFDLVVTECYYSGYGMLPVELRETVLDYFKKKTDLKNVPGQEIYYMKSKNKLNSCYGMMAQNPARDEILFNGIDFEIDSDQDCEALFTKANNKDFLSYAWGVWTTANARYELEQGIKIAHENGCIFCYTDTDSVKYKGNANFSEYNKHMYEKSMKNHAYAVDRKGNTQCMGVFEEEDPMLFFKTFGAKKYAYRLKKDSKLYLTVAGVAKKKGGIELENAGGLKSFATGFVFTEAGGTESKYNDEAYGWYEVDGNKIYITRNLYIGDSTYTLGLSKDYATLLDNLKKGYFY